MFHFSLSSICCVCGSWMASKIEQNRNNWNWNSKRHTKTQTNSLPIRIQTINRIRKKKQLHSLSRMHTCNAMHNMSISKCIEIRAFCWCVINSACIYFIVILLFIFFSSSTNHTSNASVAGSGGSWIGSSWRRIRYSSNACALVNRKWLNAGRLSIASKKKKELCRKIIYIIYRRKRSRRRRRRNYV